MLVIDKDLRALLPLADHHTGLEKGPRGDCRLVQRSIGPAGAAAR